MNTALSNSHRLTPLTFNPAPTAPQTDEQLMSAIQSGDQTALERLYDRYHSLIHSIILQVLPNGADADETLQDIFLEIWNRSHTYDPERGQLLGWIVRISRRRAIDRYRRNRVRLKATQQLEEDAEKASSTMSQSHADEPAHALSDLRTFLLHFVGELPAEQSQVLRLSYFGQMSQREIASAIGVPLGTVKTRLVLALKKLSARTASYKEELSAA